MEKSILCFLISIVLSNDIYSQKLNKGRIEFNLSLVFKTAEKQSKTAPDKIVKFFNNNKLKVDYYFKDGIRTLLYDEKDDSRYYLITINEKKIALKGNSSIMDALVDRLEINADSLSLSGFKKKICGYICDEFIGEVIRGKDTIKIKQYSTPLISLPKSRIKGYENRQTVLESYLESDKILLHTYCLIIESYPPPDEIFSVPSDYKIQDLQEALPFPIDKN